MVLLGRAAVQLGTVTDDEVISAAKFGSGLLTVGLPSAALCKLPRMWANFLPSVTSDDLRETRIKIREGWIGLPRHRSWPRNKSRHATYLARRVHDLYFNPQVQEFAPRTTWSLSNAFTSVQRTRSDPAVQGYCEARTLPRTGSRSRELIATSPCNGLVYRAIHGSSRPMPMVTGCHRAPWSYHGRCHDRA
jgi:hypothetical protein